MLIDYIFLAHLSGSRLYISVDKNKIALLQHNNQRYEADLDDQKMLLNLQGWRQIEFLPLLLLF